MVDEEEKVEEKEEKEEVKEEVKDLPPISQETKNIL